MTTQTNNRLTLINQKEDTIVASVDKNLSEQFYSLRKKIIEDTLNNLLILPNSEGGKKGKYLVFDTETSDLPKYSYDSLYEQTVTWPYVVQIAWLLLDEDNSCIDSGCYILQQPTAITGAASLVHGITPEKMREEGRNPKEIMSLFSAAVQQAEIIIAHNIDFDLPVVMEALLRVNLSNTFLYEKETYCTMTKGREVCTILNSAGNRKNPRLIELIGYLYFNDSSIEVSGTHDALIDTILAFRCFTELQKMIIPKKKAKPYFNRVAVDTINNSDLPFIDESEFIELLNNKLSNQYVITTGDSLFFGRDSIWKMIEELDGKVVKSITKTLTMAFIGYSAGPKKKEAIKKRIDAGDSIVCINDTHLQIMEKHIKDGK